MKYIIMCGANYEYWDKPRHLTKIKGEPVVARTIRLLREAGVSDIAISANHPAFEQFGVPVLRHENHFNVTDNKTVRGYWCEAFYPMDDPVCYLFGDVVFSPEAIRTIVEYNTDDVMLFGSKRPFARLYPKPHEEPFAFKVANTEHFHQAIEEEKRLADSGTHWRVPIAWELWFICCGQDPATDLRKLKDNKYVGINDYTCDIDTEADIEHFERIAECIS